MWPNESINQEVCRTKISIDIDSECELNVRMVVFEKLLSFVDNLINY
jgi:hypothetical protein